MVKYVFLCLILFVTPLQITPAADTKTTLPSIVWEKTFDDAVTKAKTAEKPILLDFFAPT